MARKLLSLVVALAVVLSSMSFAFAADPKAVSADVTDAKVKAAVEKLVAFGMVEGIDGKYVPDQKLKRSELTKLIVIALGLGPAADAAKGATQFSDVSADHWASGYITVAAGQGIVQGMGDGTFSPDSEITFAQALTMLVRALGYKDDFLKGTWPGNYLAKASEKGIYAGISIVPGAAVKRGDFAVMMSNTLDAKVVEVGEYKDGGVTYTESKVVTLLKDRFKLDKVEVRPVGNARIGEAGTDKITLQFKKTYSSAADADGVDSAVAIAIDRKTTLSIVSGFNTDPLMGVSCYAYYSKDLQKVTYLEPSGASDVYWDGIDKYVGYDTSATVLPDMKLRWSGKTFTVKGGDLSLSTTDNVDAATIYRTNGENTVQWGSSGNTGLLNTFAKSQDYGRFVVENGKIVFADLFRYESNKSGYIVKSVDAEKSVITYTDGSASENSLNLASAYTGGIKMYLNGAEISLKDLKPLDLLYISDSKVDSKNIANIFVFRKTITGTFTGVKTESDVAKSVELDSTTVTDLGDLVTYSKDNNETFKTDENTNNLNDYYGLKVIALIDNNKKIRHIYGEAVNSSEMYGIVAKIMTEAEQVKIYTPNDTAVTYGFEDTAAVYENGNNFVALGTAFDNTLVGVADANKSFLIIKYKLNKDGKIAKKTVTTTPIRQDGSDSLMLTGNFGDTTLTAAALTAGAPSKTYYSTTDMKVFDLQDTGILTVGASRATVNVDDGKLAVSKWDNFKNKEVSGTTARVYLVTDTINTNDIKAMFVIGGMGSVTLDQKAAYLINTMYVDGKSYGRFAVYGMSDIQKLEITAAGTNSSSVPSNITAAKEAAVMINMSASGKADIYANAGTADVADLTTANGKSAKNNFTTAAGYVYKIDGNKLTIGADDAAYKFEVASDAVIYEKDAIQTFGNIDIGDMVVAVMKNGIVQSLELVNAKSEKTGTYNSDSTGVGAAAMGYVGKGAGDSYANVDRITGYYITNSSLSGQVQVFGDTEGKVRGIVKNLWR